MTDLDDAIERFARPRRHVSPLPEESETVAAGWALELLLQESVIALRRRGVEPVQTVMVAAGAGRTPTYKVVAPTWPLELFALTARGVALPYTMLTADVPGGPIYPRVDAPWVAVEPTPIVVGDGPGDVEVNRRGQLQWKWSRPGRGDARDMPWTSGFRSRFEVNWSDARPGPLLEPIAFAITDHLDHRIERGVLH
ncbi:hypothetical protein [Frondihabitans australicus]|uniref:Uncharacterized protein n=1 Tax=Frondihabitans australicus TaxID=386892 RepID=A0A495IJA9_9MICO|nr:hypothetical protein [Frondihabitans australicus]RKR75206.1 hypothetical protein C8E83_2344 [Frondihabitans australicus]